MLGPAVVRVIIGLLAAGLFVAAPAQAADVKRCLNLTTRTSLDSGRITDGLGLPASLVKELRSRLSQFNSVRGFPGIEGIGLTPEQIAEVQRRIDVQVAAMNRYPLGWPCKPFKRPAEVIRYVRGELIANGFRPRMTIRLASPRQIQFVAIQDGVEMWGTVAKTGARQITIQLSAPHFGQTKAFSLTFEP